MHVYRLVALLAWEIAFFEIVSMDCTTSQILGQSTGSLRIMLAAELRAHFGLWSVEV